MSTNIFLGYPPENIKQFIINNYSKPVDMTKVPLHFIANEDNSSVSLVCWDNDAYGFIDPWCKLDYSMDGATWQTYIDPDSSDEILRKGKVINLNKGETVYFKATLGKDDENPNMNGFGYYDEDAEYITKWHYFVMEGSIKADGNIQFLLENTGTKMDVPKWCYYNMFYKWSEEENYNTALTQAPELPATTLADNCYNSMFYNCVALTQAPELPAKTLANNCYSNMFYGCTNLTQAPELPATTLADNCYQLMFGNCTNLNSINVNFSTWNTRNATYYWVSGVSSSGTFTCPADLPEEFGTSRIPSGWTVVRK